MSHFTLQYKHLSPSIGVVPDTKHSIRHDAVLSTHTVFELLKYSTRGVNSSVLPRRITCALLTVSGWINVSPGADLSTNTVKASSVCCSCKYSVAFVLRRRLHGACIFEQLMKFVFVSTGPTESTRLGLKKPMSGRSFLADRIHKLHLYLFVQGIKSKLLRLSRVEEIF